IPFSLLLGVAFVLDLVLGDPRWLPHPVRAIGWLARVCEGLWRRLVSGQRLAGVMTVLSVLTGVGGVVLVLIEIGQWIHPLAGDAVRLYFMYASFAARDLACHSQQVHAALADGDLPLARQRVAMIVGRETVSLDEVGVSRACVESVAENIVDGVTAPLLWAAVAGPVGAMAYKAVNTMDSMFGYKNERYCQFGWAPARLDDLANFLPARLTALMVVFASAFLGYAPRLSYHIWRRDRRNHSSPNSAHTEAAVAGALGIQLGGPSVYFGAVVDKPTIGDPHTPLTARHIVAVNRLMLATAVITVLLVVLAHGSFWVAMG
ncbi:MAG: adenosylcobinamide-phosphate synthase CbiB, partial [Desulfobulbaceae bacterium]|nr:adenosylcobinamide-phosphate synthase CbiB [Desulfobulbaceae bacterium]